MYSYCFFCQTQRCKAVARRLAEITGGRGFSPQILQRKWVKGRMLEESHDWLPGYVFLYTQQEIVYSFRVDGIIRLLGAGPLMDQDLDFAMSLLKANGVMGNVRLLEVGDRCEICDPVWDGVQGRIVKLDRNRKRCCVEYRFDENIRQVWVGYDMVKGPEEGI